MNLYLDIETIPGQLPYIREDIATGITAPGNFKKPESIEKWLAENRDAETDKAWRKTSFDGTRGEIICIGYATDDNQEKCVARDLGQPEGDMLKGFFTELQKDLGTNAGGSPHQITQWVGHNITGFDLRFLWQRCVINGINPPIGIPVTAKPWDSIVFDTMTEWGGIGKKMGCSLDAICKALGIETKDDLNGSKVWDYVKDGRVDEVAEYCKKDVMRTREIHNRLLFK